MARRLIERGVRFAQVNFSRFVTQRGYGWDTHGQRRETLRDHLLPKLNAGLGTLLTEFCTSASVSRDVGGAMGEFGRRRASSRTAVAITGPTVTRCCWPAAASTASGVRPLGSHWHSRQWTRWRRANPDDVLTLVGVPTFVTDRRGGRRRCSGRRPVRRLYS